MTFNVKSEILSAIGKNDDSDMKMVLLLLLGVIEEIGGKIDTILKDENTLRRLVLKDLADTHDHDHSWIVQHKIENATNQELIKRVAPIILWAENSIKLENKRKISGHNIVMSLLEKTLWVLLGGLGYALLLGFQQLLNK